MQKQNKDILNSYSKDKFLSKCLDSYYTSGRVIEHNKMIILKADSFKKDLIKNSTTSESYFIKFLNFIKLKFEFQYPIFISDKYNSITHFYIADFYIPSLRAIIELDGEYHETKEQALKDKKRTEEIKTNYKLRVLRFSNNNAYDLDFVLRCFKKYLGFKKTYDSNIIKEQIKRK